MLDKNKNTLNELDKLPKYFVIKRDASNFLWQKYIDWLNETYKTDLKGTCDDYYGFDGEVKFYINPKYFDNNPTILTLEQWDNIVNPKEFVLPKKWCIKGRNLEENRVLAKFINKTYNKNLSIDYSETCYYNNRLSSMVSKNKPFDCEEITFEQFKKYVLKEDNDMEKYTIQQCIDQKIAIRCYSAEEGEKILKSINIDGGFLYKPYNEKDIKSYEILITKINSDYNFHWNPSYDGSYFIIEKMATKCIEFKQVILDNMEENKEIIGYKLIKPEYEKIALKALDLKSAHNPFIIAGMLSYYIPKIKDLDIMHWFEPVYKPKYELPEINGYKGSIEANQIQYGCAFFDKAYFGNVIREIQRFNSKINNGISGNRAIKSITLDSNVNITIDQLKQIVDYINNK